MQYNSLINKKIKKIKINVLLTFFNYFYLKIIIIYYEFKFEIYFFFSKNKKTK